MAPSSRMPRYPLIAGGGSLVLLAILLIVAPWAALWSLLLVQSIAAFLLFRWDKGRAGQANAWRVPERYLLAWIWLGGVVGAAAGMYMRPRHKTQKIAFTASLLGAALLWAALTVLWLRW